MSDTEYFRLLDDENRIRVKFYTERGRVDKFSVQYESHIEGSWEAIVRYDTAHGFAHKDVMMPNGSQKKESVDVGDFGSAMTYAQEDLLQKLEQYRDDYLRRTKR